MKKIGGSSSGARFTELAQEEKQVTYIRGVVSIDVTGTNGNVTAVISQKKQYIAHGNQAVVVEVAGAIVAIKGAGAIFNGRTGIEVARLEVGAAGA
jgi:DNA/RNA endonuclease YhcR with UshA esterase domain